MKKFLCCILCAVIGVLMTACFAEETPAKEIGKGVQASSEEKELVFGLNDTAAFKDLKFTASEILESDGDDFFTPEKDKIFVGVKFTVENISNEEQAVSSLLLFEGYVDDIKCEYSFNAACAFDEGTLDGSLAPGKKLVGWYALEVPKNWSSIELNVQSNWLSSNTARFVLEK